MCMCLARGGEWVGGLGLGFTNPLGTGRECNMCLCLGCGGVGEWVGGCCGIMCVCCDSGLFV